MTVKELSKEELSTTSIYYMCSLFGIEPSNLSDNLVETMFNNLNKFDYNEVFLIYDTLRLVYENYHN